MSEALETLLAVQERDTSMDRLRLRRRELPERARLFDISRQISILDGELSEVGGRRDELLGRQAKMEDDIGTAVDRIHQIESRLYGGEVSASRELQAMSDEVRSIQRRRSMLEDQVVVLMEEVEPLEAEVSGLQSERASLESDAGDVRRGLAAAEAAIDAEIAVEAEARAALAADLPTDLAQSYERIRYRLGGVGAARLVNASCSGCHLALPAMELDRVRHAPPGAVLTCDQCGRILVP